MAMAAGLAISDDVSPRHPAGIHAGVSNLMNSSPTSKISSASGLTRLSLLDIVIARHARNHDAHESPIVGCYLCLTGAPRIGRELRAAA